MSIDLSPLSLEELVALIGEAKALIVEKQELNVQKGYLQVVQIANELGLSVEELMARGEGMWYGIGPGARRDSPRALWQWANRDDSKRAT